MIDGHEVQSLIVHPRPAARMELVFLRFRTRRDLATVLAAAAEAVDVAATTDTSTWAVNVGLTGAGLVRAGVGARTMAALSPAFVGGMRAAARRLGDDEGTSTPDRWVAPFGPDDRAVDMVLVAVGPSAREGGGPVADPVLDLVATAQAHAAQEVTWRGDRRPGGTEPFGFADGVSNPVIAGSGQAMRPGHGIWEPTPGRWRPVRAGEAVLGHLDEAGVVAGDRDAAWIERDGSYLVVRRLQQHVDRFWEHCRAWGAALGLSGEEVAERIVGRRRDGRALGQPAGCPISNDFLYRSPRDAAPVAAPTSHIRRSQPRDDIEEARTVVPRHIMFRRGIPYREDDGEEGLLFLAVCADIRRQFEFVQARWLQDGNRFGLGDERDPLTGERPGLASPGEPRPPRKGSIDGPDGARVTRALPGFVTTRGGEYFLLPSRSALELLARRAAS